MLLLYDLTNLCFAFIGLISSIIPVSIIIKLPIRIEFILIDCSPNNIYPTKKC